MADQGHVHPGRRRHGPQRGARVPALSEEHDGGLEDRDSVVNALETRETSAGVYVSPEGIEFFTASAGNAQIAQVVSQLAAGMQAGISAQLNEATAAATEAAVLQGTTGEDILAIQQRSSPAEERSRPLSDHRIERLTSPPVPQSSEQGHAGPLL